jgi:NAD(P)-dependent dehydrogenase (short-subunit alcohol dehydrogenase family)
MELTDKVIVVTGGANGIGAAMCRRFAAEGARGIVVADLDADTAATVAAEVGGIAMRTDVASEADVRSMIEVTEETYGPVDVLCLNAGIPTGGSVDAPNDAWQRAWDVNVMSHVYAVRAVLPSMLARGEGYLLHTASAAGLLTNLGAAPYSVTKHAVVALAEWLSVTYGDAGIRVSALCPQFVQTGMLDALTEVGTGFHDLAVATSISTEEVAAAVVEGIHDERFLILPHPEVAGYFANKANDYERWLDGMRRLQRRVDAGPR